MMRSINFDFNSDDTFQLISTSTRMIPSTNFNFKWNDFFKEFRLQLRWSLQQSSTATQMMLTEYWIPSTEYRIPNTEYRIPSTEDRINWDDTFDASTSTRVIPLARLWVNTYRVPNIEYRISITEYRVPCTEYRVPSIEYRIQNRKPNTGHPQLFVLTSCFIDILFVLDLCKFMLADQHTVKIEILILYSVFGIRYSVLGTRYSVFGIRYLVLGIRYSVFGTRYSVLGKHHLSCSPTLLKGSSELRVRHSENSTHANIYCFGRAQFSTRYLLTHIRCCPYILLLLLCNGLCYRCQFHYWHC